MGGAIGGLLIVSFLIWLALRRRRQRNARTDMINSPIHPSSFMDASGAGVVAPYAVGPQAGDYFSGGNVQSSFIGPSPTIQSQTPTGTTQQGQQSQYSRGHTYHSSVDSKAGSDRALLASPSAFSASPPASPPTADRLSNLSGFSDNDIERLAQAVVGMLPHPELDEPGNISPRNPPPSYAPDRA